jgi:hypothetical protein
LEPQDAMQPEVDPIAAKAPATEDVPDVHATKVEIRSIVAARAWVSAVRALVGTVALVFAVPCIQILGYLCSGASHGGPASSVEAVSSLFLIECSAVALFFALPRFPRQSLAILKWVLAGIVATLLAGGPLSSLLVKRFLPTHALPVLFFMVVVGLPLLTLDSDKMNRWTRGPAVVLALLLVGGLGGVISEAGWGITFVAYLALLVAIAQARVESAWPAIERHPKLFKPTRRRRRHGEIKPPRLTSPRVPSGIARSYSRWREISKPAVRTGGMTGLGMR